jgi:hypothetical protein
MANVALYDVDSKIPNLALMKLSTHHKNLGDTTERYDPLWASTYDAIYASKIFDFSDGSQIDPERMTVGGTGWDMGVSLAPSIEVLTPDYTLYNYPHSIGFAMRGCRFRCKFCVVPEKEGRPKSNSSIADIWTNRTSDFIVLLDNDFFGNPDWRDRITELRDLNLRVNLNQGLNIRLITVEQAAAIASLRFRSLSGKSKTIHFAWDRMRDERLIDKGFARCIEGGIKPHEMAFYVLIGFDSTPEEDLRRVTKLRDLGTDPFVMPYKRDDPYQRRFARWVNHRAIFKTVAWEEYNNTTYRQKEHEGQLPLIAG